MILAMTLAAAILRLPRGLVRKASHRFAATRDGGVDAAEYFDTVAGELRRGSSLRHALAAPVPGSRLARLALTGQPIDLVAAEVGAMLRLDDELPIAGIRLASRTGAPASRVFGRLAEQARAVKQHERDRAAATAQARLSAGVIGLLPLTLGLATLVLGNGHFVTRPGPARTAVIIGVSLQLTGLLIIGALLRFDR